MQQAPLLAEVMNPRNVQNYSEESLIVTRAKKWAKSVSGRYMHVAQWDFLAKKLVGLLLRFDL